MQPNNRSSFIPKKSIKRVERVRSGRRIYILSYIAYAVFFATIVSSGAVYFYAQYLKQNLATRIEELEAQRVAFNQSNIQAVKEVERQLKLAEYLFSRHTSPYAVLYEVERLATDDVIFKTFNYTRQDNDDIMVTISGGAERFDSVAFQTGLFANSSLFANSLFTQIIKQNQGSVTNGQLNVTASSQTTNDAVATPVSFTLTKTLSFGELAFNPSIYELTSVSGGNLNFSNTDTGSNSVSDTSEIETVSSELDNQTDL